MPTLRCEEGSDGELEESGVTSGIGRASFEIGL